MIKSNSIATNIAKFKETKNPLYLSKVIYLVIIQGRSLEVTYGAYCSMFHRPSLVKVHPKQELQTILESVEALLSTTFLLRREDLIDIFGKDYAICDLPENFNAVRMESIVLDQDFLILGEYGDPGKRVAFITRQSCIIKEFYNKDASVRHIHAIYKSSNSNDILVSVGDNAKYLDSWSLLGNDIIFSKRLKKYLAGYTAITMVRGQYYMGTDFSSRPNYIESIDGKKYFFPKKAYKMYTSKFYKYQDRYIISLNNDLDSMGTRYTISIFDVEQQEFIYCDYQDYLVARPYDKALHRTATLQRSR